MKDTGSFLLGVGVALVGLWLLKRYKDGQSVMNSGSGWVTETTKPCGCQSQNLAPIQEDTLGTTFEPTFYQPPISVM
jgi:hypothetical protein